MRLLLLEISPKKKALQKAERPLEILQRSRFRAGSGRDRGRPSHDRCANGDCLRPTNDGTRASSVRGLPAVHGGGVPPACCTSRVAQWLREACSLPWQCGVGTCSKGLHGQKRAARPRKPEGQPLRRQPAPRVPETSSLPKKWSCSPSSKIARLGWGAGPALSNTVARGM